MQYWLMKSEPDVWSIDQQKKSRCKRVRPGMVLEIIRLLKI
jgi:predicted RNA-binding protein with PUA-like domain